MSAIALDQQLLDRLIQRIVDAVHPLRIVLFGSAARGEMTEDSDVDLLVVMPEGTGRRQVAQKVHRELLGIPLSVDVVVATTEDLERYGQHPSLIYRTALEEGRTVYADV